jgi:hypothetical protein
MIVRIIPSGTGSNRYYDPKNLSAGTRADINKFCTRLFSRAVVRRSWEALFSTLTSGRSPLLTAETDRKGKVIRILAMASSPQPAIEQTAKMLFRLYTEDLKNTVQPFCDNPLFCALFSAHYLVNSTNRDQMNVFTFPALALLEHSSSLDQKDALPQLKITIKNNEKDVNLLTSYGYIQYQKATFDRLFQKITGAQPQSTTYAELSFMPNWASMIITMAFIEDVYENGRLAPQRVFPNPLIYKNGLEKIELRDLYFNHVWFPNPGVLNARFGNRRVKNDPRFATWMETAKKQFKKLDLLFIKGTGYDTITSGSPFEIDVDACGLAAVSMFMPEDLKLSESILASDVMKHCLNNSSVRQQNAMGITRFTRVDSMLSQFNSGNGLSFKIDFFT